jgi:hypothetical protein
MLKLFQSIFRPGADKLGAYPEDLIERAIERAVDSTDGRLRALPRYKKSLRPAIIHAIDHVMAMVDHLPPPLELSRRSFGSNAEVSNYFASVEDMEEILSRDAEMRQWQKSSDNVLAERVVMLLIMVMRERNVLGVALEGSEVRRDVAQVTVSFSKHRTVDPTAVEDDTRRLLKRRAFDHLLSLALGSIAAGHSERRDLERERDLLRLKVAALAGGRWGFGDDTTGEATDPETVQQRLAEIDTQLGTLGTGLLQSNLDTLIDVLSRAEENFRWETLPLCIDRQGVKQAQPSMMAPETTLTALHNSAGQSVIVRLVSIGRADLPKPRDFLREAQGFLG